jgi:hypothetical protein
MDLKVYSNNSDVGSIVNYFGNKDKHKAMRSHLELFSSYKIKSISLKNILNKYTKRR